MTTSPAVILMVLRRTGMLVLALSGCGGGAPPAAADPAHDKSTASAAGPTAATVDLTGYRTAIDLVTNRLHATVHLGGRLIVDAGSTDFYKYADGGWKTSWLLGEREGDRRVALVSGLSAQLFLPFDRDPDGAGAAGTSGLSFSFTGRAFSPNQRVSVFVNEKSIGTLDVASDHGDHELPVPGDVLVEGENRVRMTFRSAGSSTSKKRSAAAIERLTLGPTATPAARATARLESGSVGIGGVRRRALTMPGGPSRISFYVQVPEGGHLAVAVGSESSGASAVVRVTADGTPVRVLHEGAAGSRWSDLLLDLGPMASRAVRLDLVARGGPVSWGEPRIVVKKEAAKPTEPLRRVNRILIWMVDTFRADKMRAYNPKTRVETPNYDAFAAEATRFEWAHVPGTWSLPSHASLLTGVYPTVHKAVAHEARLSRDVAFVAEEMKKGGYRTAIFSSNGYVSAKWGFDRGWDHSRNFIRESLPNGADYLWKTAKPWIMQGLQKPQFVYLATVEPHVIYNPKKEFLQKYWKKPYTGPIKPALTGIQLGKIKAGSLRLNETDRAYIEALHDAEITQSDAAFAVFLADLKAAGIYDSSAIVVVSDHGDEFWDHGDVGHAQSVHQELVRIPLIIRAPGWFPGGRVVRTDVEVMDLYPTILELAGLKPGPQTQGASLVPLAHDEVGRWPGAALALNGGISRGLKIGRYRLIHAGTQKIQLFDQVEDRQEQRDVAAQRPIALRQMRQAFGLLYAHESRWSKSRWGTAANITEGFWRDLGS